MKVAMTRTVSFSSGHRFWFAHLSDEENRRLFPGWGSPYNHGHNYRLDVTVEGMVNRETGMVVNIKDIDAILKSRIVPEFAQKSINDEVPYFATHTPSLENMMPYLWREILEAGLPPEVQMTSLRLEELPNFYGEYDGMKTTITRIYEFAAAHRLHAPGLSDERNRELFGKCNNEAGHGHNYVLEVTVSGQLDETTGMMCSIIDVDAAVGREVVDRYDHKNFNCDIPEFEGKPTTSESIAEMIFSRLDGHIPATLERIRLWETPRSVFEVCKNS
ncbi:MAG: 6-carboxytetrahydropterin synthase [Armatimonadetes bacterium]|nr:6-carboxytetrahydropterin synthase [Armatimonadota bacterium]